MKTKYVVISFILANLVAMIVWSRSFVEYVPLKLQEGRTNKLVPAPELNTPAHLARVKIILEHGGWDWRTNSNGKPLIRRSDARDKELIWNLTNHAEDIEFMKSFYGMKIDSPYAPTNAP